MDGFQFWLVGLPRGMRATRKWGAPYSPCTNQSVRQTARKASSTHSVGVRAMAQAAFASGSAARRTDHFTSGRNSSQRTPVSSSICGQNSAGTRSFFQREMEAFCLPRASASLVEPPAMAQARSRGDCMVMSEVSGNYTSLYRVPKQHKCNIDSRAYAFSMGFTDRLKEARKAAGLTGQQLGDAIGCSKQNISHWEAGRFEPNLTYIVKLCDILDVSSDWLLLGKAPDSLSAGALKQARFYEALSPEAKRRWETLKMLMVEGASDATVERRMPITAKPPRPAEPAISSHKKTED